MPYFFRNNWAVKPDVIKLRDSRDLYGRCEYLLIGY